MRSRLTRREFLAGAGAAAVSLPFLNATSALAVDERPNFVFILTDDQRYDAMSCAGHPFMLTPNMDRIAREGVRFRNAFVTTSLCAPSRACFLTGQYAHKHGVRDNSTKFSDDVVTYPRLLQKAGYDTAFIGKWHMDGQEGPRPGFNRWVSFKAQGVYWNPLLNVDGERVQAAGYTTDLLTNYAVDWLKQPRKGPFCLYLPHKACHGPFSPALRHSKLYSDVKIGRPANFKDDLRGRPKWMQLGMEKGHDGYHALENPENYDRLVRDYCRTLMAVDDSVGRIFSTLKALGVLDNTVIVFAGDNGYFLGEHGRLDKRTAQEESIRIPMLMRYPRLIRPGTVADEIVLNIDIAPTLLELAGIKPPDSVQGRSMCALLRGDRRDWRRDFLYEYYVDPGFPRTPTMYAVRGERWKYTEYPEANDIPELYDLRNDPTEMNNLAGDPKQAHVLSEMRERLRELQKETGV